VFKSEGDLNGIKIPLKSICSRVLIATGILKRTLARSRKEEKDIEKGATVYF
jgi:hypothetical protein